ncbi:hypothetical protein NC652_000906 [Populus alba x Populus x berolinensis]|nr:hypothetical protein NC652_000906 [Populus alba x Populus x berolinensis]
MDLLLLFAVRKVALTFEAIDSPSLEWGSRLRNQGVETWLESLSPLHQQVCPFLAPSFFLFFFFLA